MPHPQGYFVQPHHQRCCQQVQFFFLVDGKIRILEAQKSEDPTDPDPAVDPDPRLQ